jgi:ComF family protein
MFERRLVIVNQWDRFRLTAARGLSRLLAATLFPPACCLCGFAGASLDVDLCQYCHADLPWDAIEADALTALRYEHPVDEMVRRLKYRGEFAMARVLGALLAEVVRQRGEPLPRLLVPVPLHPARMNERGFNQAAAIARFAGRLLEVPIAARALCRVRDTPSQTALDVEARALNVCGAFGVASARDIARLTDVDHVAIVDDVMTTGSTLRAARAALLAVGVSRVDLWAVARVP